VIEQYLSNCTSLFNKGNYQAAIAGYEFVLKLAPNSIQAYRGAAICYSHLHNWNKAFTNILNALLLGNHQKKELIVLFDFLDRSQLNSYLVQIEKALIAAMSHPELENKAIALLSRQIKAKHPCLLNQDINQFNIETDLLIQDKSFCHLIESQLNNNFTIESFLLLSRKEILEQFVNGKDIQRFIPFLSSLACQILLNNGLYSHTVEEETLLTKVTAANTKNIAELLISICYSDISNIMSLWKQNKSVLEASNLTSLVSDLQFYSNVKANNFNNHVEDNLSKTVQSFYIENPYPTWKTTKIDSDIKGIDPIFTLSGKSSPSDLTVLSAGCGTGMQLINLARAIPNASIVAIDICPTSLTYAKLMCQKYAITNIEFHLLDILDASELDLKFDYIMCTGVLHHMSSPQDGLNALSSVLNPEGVMHLAFYSTLARRELTDIKHDILHTLNTDENSITRECVKKWRSQLTDSQKQNKWFHLADFFSLSGLYDLLFHPQQAEYRPLEVKALLDNAELSFQWMSSVPNAKSILSRYPLPKTGETLHYWEKIEQDNPDTFRGMISFYATKQAIPTTANSYPLIEENHAYQLAPDFEAINKTQNLHQ